MAEEAKEREVKSTQQAETHVGTWRVWNQTGPVQISDFPRLDRSGSYLTSVGVYWNRAVRAARVRAARAVSNVLRESRTALYCDAAAASSSAVLL